MNSSRLRSAGSGASLDSAPDELPMDSSTLQQPSLPLSLSLGRSPDSHAREKARMHTNLQILWSTAGSMLSGLHCTAPHRTAPHGRLRQKLHCCTPSIHFLARIARVPSLTGASALLLADFMPCAVCGSQRLGALGACATLAQGSR